MIKRVLFPVFATLLVAGILLHREAGSGVFESQERAVSGLMTRALAGAQGGIKGVTLVIQGGISGAELSPLDVALFTRAASRLGASVAAVCSWRLPESAITLEPSPAEPGAPRAPLVGGALLLNRESRTGKAPSGPAAVAGASAVSGLVLQSFSGFHSSFPSNSGWETGFLNPPDSPSEEPLAPVVASLEGGPVFSFAALCALISSSPPDSARLLPPGRGYGAYLLGEGWRLPLRADGNLPMDSSLLRNVARVDMDDLLLEAERAARGSANDPEVTGLVRDRIVILGTLALDDAAGAAAGGRRKLSLAEYQSLAVVNLLSHIEPVAAPWPAALAAILFSMVVAVGIWRLRRAPAALAAAAAFCLWLLLIGPLFVAAGYAIPVLAPAGLLLCALLLRIFSPDF